MSDKNDLTAVNDYEGFDTYNDFRYKQSTKNPKSWCIIQPDKHQILKHFDSEVDLKIWIDTQV